MRPGSVRPVLVLAGIVAVEVVVTALSVCRDQALSAVVSLAAIGAAAFALVALAILGHRFIGQRISATQPDPQPWAWRRPWFAAALASVVSMGLIAVLGLEVVLTQPGRCG